MGSLWDLSISAFPELNRFGIKILHPQGTFIFQGFQIFSCKLGKYETNFFNSLPLILFVSILSVWTLLGSIAIRSSDDVLTRISFSWVTVQESIWAFSSLLRPEQDNFISDCTHEQGSWKKINFVLGIK